MQMMQIIFQLSKFISAVGNCQGFYWGEQCFYSNHFSKILLRWLCPSKIYIQFTIFSTYFLTKLLLTNKRYHFHMLEKCLFVLEEVRSIIYFQQFIHPLSLCSHGIHGNEVSNSCSNVLIIMTLFRKIKRMSNMGHMP